MIGKRDEIVNENLWERWRGGICDSGDLPAFASTHSLPSLTPMVCELPVDVELIVEIDTCYGAVVLYHQM